MGRGVEQCVFKSDDRRSRFWFRRFCSGRGENTALDDGPSEAHAEVHFHEDIAVKPRALPQGLNSKAAEGRAIFAVARRLEQREQCNRAHHPEFLRAREAHFPALRPHFNVVAAHADALPSVASRRALNLTSASRARLK